MAGPYVTFGAKIDGVVTAINQLEGHIEGFTGKLGEIKASFHEIAEAIASAFAIEKINEFARSMGELGEQTQRAAAMLGVSAEDASRLGYIAKATGTDVQGLQSAFNALARGMADESDDTKRALTALGLSFKSLQGKDTTAQLGVIADAMAKVKDGANKTAIAQELLGRSGVEMIPMLNRGSEAFDEMARRADELGVTLDAKTAASFAATKEKFTDLTESFRGAGIQVFQAMQPAVDGIVTAFTDLAVAFTQSAKEGGAMAQVLEGFKQFFNSLAEAVVQVIGFIRTLGVTAIEVGEQIGNAFALAADVLSATFSSKAKDAGASLEALGRAAVAIAKGIGQAFADAGAIIAAALSMDFSGVTAAFESLKKNAAGAIGDVASQFREARKGFSVVDDIAIEADMTKMKGSAKKAADANLQIQKDMKKQMEAIWGVYGPTQPPPKGGGRDAKMATKDDGSGKDATNAALKELEGERQAQQALLAQKIAIWNGELAQKKITEQEKYALVEQATQDEYEAERAILQKELQIDGLKLTQKADINNKLKALETKHTTDMINLDNQAIQASMKNWQDGLGSITQAFNSQLKGLIAGTTSWKQALGNIFQDLGMKILNVIEKMVVDWAAAQLAMTTASTTGAAARATAETTGQAASIASTLGTALSKIGAGVAATIAGVTANQAPFIGPLAPAEGIAAGAATEAAAMGALAVGSFNVGSWALPSDGMAMVHRGEMILPSSFASSVRDSLMGGGEGGGGGDTHFHAHSLDPAAAMRMFKGQMGRNLAREVGRQQSRNPSLRPTY